MLIFSFTYRNHDVINFYIFLKAHDSQYEQEIPNYLILWPIYNPTQEHFHLHVLLIQLDSWDSEKSQKIQI
ncbi:UNVERIFIED_CONTAM: hypothetical protein NCL1_07659 [Trichonephila clavipes]